MKTIYHICFSSHDEVMFRNQDDYRIGNNLIALALLKTDTQMLAGVQMSNHCHFIVRTENPSLFVNSFRIGYGKMFNSKYYRSGKLGEKGFYYDQIEGTYHILAAISYVLRNPSHHGVSPTPFSYRYSSCHCYFIKELGLLNQKQMVDKTEQRKHLPSRIKLPHQYTMSEDGFILHNSFIESSLVENYYGTVRSFLFYMNRLTNDDWIKEQTKDETSSPPISLDSIENSTGASVTKMLMNEKGKNRLLTISDLELCEFIDTKGISKYHKKSYCFLSPKEKEELSTYLINTLHATNKQVHRCLGLQYKSE